MSTLAAKPVSKYAKTLFQKMFIAGNSDITIINFGFALGFVHQCNANDLVKYPLSVACIASIAGCFTSLGSCMASIFVPPQIKFVIPLAICMSCTHHIFKKSTRTINEYKSNE